MTTEQAARWGFRLQGAEKSETLDLEIYDVIADDFWFGGVSARDILAKLKGATSTRRINVRINSAGGDVTEGVAIYNLLREHRARVVVTIDGLAASMASAVAMAGDRIKMHENALLMVHNPWMVAIGDADRMRHHAETLERAAEALAITYSKRSGLPLARVRELMDAETYMTAAEAQELGFVDEVLGAKEKPDAARATERVAIWAQARSTTAMVAAARYVIDPTEQPAAKLGGDNPEPQDEEDPMSVKTEEVQAELKASEKAREGLQAELTAKTATITALTAENDKLKAQAVTLTERATAAESRLIEADVDVLVGKKITPAEKPAYLALAKSDRKAFDELVAARPDLGLVGERRAVDPGQGAPAATNVVDDFEEVVARHNQASA